MSNAVICDKCKKSFYTDSRSPKGAYCSMTIEYTDGTSFVNLCRECHKKFWVDFLEDCSSEDYDDCFPIGGG